MPYGHPEACHEAYMKRSASLGVGSGDLQPPLQLSPNDYHSDLHIRVTSSLLILTSPSKPEVSSNLHIGVIKTFREHPNRGL